MKRIGDSHWNVWGHDLAIGRSEQKYALAKDQDTFEMQKMMVRTNQLLHIMEATGSKSTSGGQKLRQTAEQKKVVQLLKQYHAWSYHFYEKVLTRAMIGLHGLHSNDVFWCFNVAASMGLKLFCPWCFKLGGNTKTITNPLEEGAL